MTGLTRRRFIAISAAATGLAALPARAQDLYQWRGVALGAGASIILAHPDAKAIVARAVAEIGRLETIFSLYRTDSALTALNRDGYLAAPPFELLECLSLCGRVHAATDGLFDPTVQPLWALYASRFAAGAVPTADEILAARLQVGWDRVAFDSTGIRLAPGMALTLNGVAQGWIADRVADMLRAEGLGDILINTGELRALGGRPGGGDWPVKIATGGQVPLRDRALASSAPLGTTFDSGETVGHILDPRTGHPASTAWRLISISAGSAALADALSTAACLMPDRATVLAAMTAFPDSRIEALS
jgi:thiamine biosynthesis lipoprotein